MRSSWKRRLVERAERKAMKEREHDLKEGAKKEKEVRYSDMLYNYLYPPPALTGAEKEDRG